MEWKEYKLGEVCSYVVDRIDNSTLNKNNYISTENMTPNCGGVTSASNVPDGKSIWFKEGDILFSNIRPYFKKLWKADISGGCSADVLCIRANEKINPTYLYYLLIQDTFISYVMKGTKGCKMPRGDKKYNMAWVIDLPSLEVQKRIAAQLSEIDDKIAVNKKICENLEAQAQALFKHWFIDFAPFKNGKFVESELGMIPEGWRVGTLGDIAVITMGQSPAGSSYNEKGDGVFFYQGRTEFGFRYPSVRLYTTDPKRFAEPLSTLLSVRAPVGDINVATERCCIGRGLASIKSNNNCHSYIFYLLQSMKRRFDVYNGEGTVFGSINKDTLNGLKIFIPNNSIISDFEEIVEEIDKKILESHQESSRLSSLRDTLLPKLMSGEIKV